MSETNTVPVLFYGTYMSASVLIENGVQVKSTELVTLEDYCPTISHSDPDLSRRIQNSQRNNREAS